MFKLDLDSLKHAAASTRLMANSANAANRLTPEAEPGSQLANLATLAISHGSRSDAEDAAEWQDERAGILEFDAGLTREEAEAEAARLHAAWLVRDRLYQKHHWQCPTCCAAGQGRGLRCGVGASLWAHYSEG